MPLAPKVIFHSPLSDEGLLEAFVAECLRDGVSLLAIVGPGCARLEEAVDRIVVGDGLNRGRFLCTTSHPDEPLEDVLTMVQAWDAERGGAIQEVRF
jgi:hypothetical protein